MMSMNLSNIDVSNNKGAHYRCIISGISKSEALILTQNIDLIKKKKKKIVVKHKNSLSKIKMRRF